MSSTDRFTILEAIDPDVNLVLNEDYCSHITLSNLPNELLSRNWFLLLNQNVQSFHSKKPHLEALITAANHSFHALVLTETWNSAHNHNLCNIDGYNAVHSYRNTPIPTRGGIGGGVSVLADLSLYKIEKVDHLSFCNVTLEACTAHP